MVLGEGKGKGLSQQLVQGLDLSCEWASHTQKPAQSIAGRGTGKPEPQMGEGLSHPRSCNVAAWVGPRDLEEEEGSWSGH